MKNQKNIRVEENSFFVMKLSMKFFLARLLIKLHLSQYFIIKQKHYNLRFFPSTLSRELWINPQYLDMYWKYRTNFFWNYLIPGDIVIDIGSHIGTVTLESASKVGDSGKIYSIEAHPKIFKFLNQNISLNNFQNITTFNLALGNESGIVNFSDLHTDPSNVVISNDDGIKVEMKKLDELSITESKISLLKIYVEGFEKFVFLGGKELLTKVDCVHFSCNIQKFKENNYEYKEIFSFLSNCGFSLYRFHNESQITAVTSEYSPKKEEMLAIRNMNDFLKRTGYKILKH